MRARYAGRHGAPDKPPEQAPAGSDEQAVRERTLAGSDQLTEVSLPAARLGKIKRETARARRTHTPLAVVPASGPSSRRPDLLPASDARPARRASCQVTSTLSPAEHPCFHETARRVSGSGSPYGLTEARAGAAWQSAAREPRMRPVGFADRWGRVGSVGHTRRPGRRRWVAACACTTWRA
jgi:hypothetical protein